MANKVTYLIQLKDKFSATANKFKRSIDSSAKSSDRLGGSLKGKLSPQLAGMAAHAKTAATQLFSLAGILGTIRVGAQFQDSVAELSAITGATGGALDDMADSARRMAREFGISQEIVVGALTQTASAKSELLETSGAVATVTREALRLSKAAGIAVPDAIKASIGALNQFSLGSDQAGRFVNVLAAGSKIGASMVGETAEALKNAGTVAAQFNLSFEETNALLQVLAKNEIKGAEAGTALRGTLVKLEGFMGGRFAPSKIGIIKSLEKIESLGLSNSQVIKAFGQENLRSLLVLRQNIPLVKRWTDELTGSSEAGTQAAIRMDTFNAKLSQLMVSLKSVGIRVFEGWEPVLSRIISLITGAINTIDGFLSGTGELLGQTLGAISTLNFKQFDFSAIKSAFLNPFGKEVPKPTPKTPVTGAKNTLNGQIIVSAERGSKVERTKLEGRGPLMNFGLNMAGSY